MTTNEAVMVIAVICIMFGIPLAGLVIRFALRPLVHDIAAAIRGKDPGPEQEEMLRRLVELESRLEDQERRMADLVEAQRFRRELEAGRPAASPPAPRADDPS